MVCHVSFRSSQAYRHMMSESSECAKSMLLNKSSLAEHFGALDASGRASKVPGSSEAALLWEAH